MFGWLVQPKAFTIMCFSGHDQFMMLVVVADELHLLFPCQHMFASIFTLVLRRRSCSPEFRRVSLVTASAYTQHVDQAINLTFHKLGVLQGYLDEFTSF